MPEYKEQVVDGVSRCRASSITFSNPINGLPLASFNEEELTTLSNGQILSRPLGQLSACFSESESFQLLGQDNSPTGQSMTHGELLLVLRSLYLHHAMQRDGGVF